MSAPRFFVGAIPQRSATVTAAIRLFFSPALYLNDLCGIVRLPHRSNKGAAVLSPERNAPRSEATCCLADPGSFNTLRFQTVRFQTLRLRRSRISGASLRHAPRRGNVLELRGTDFLSDFFNKALELGRIGAL
jgi:hypothetical protein